MDKRESLSAKNDLLFRSLFADSRNKELLVSFLKSVLLLPEDDYHVIEIVDPHLLPEFTDDKLAIIDIKLKTKSGKIIHIEVQLEVPGTMKQRIVLYGARLIAEQIGKGVDYSVIKKVISIIITEETLIKGVSDYHHRFSLYDPKDDTELSDIYEVHTIELGKLPKETDGTELYEWARFIAAETKEEREMAVIKNPKVAEAVIKLEEMLISDEARSAYEYRLKMERDKIMWMNEMRERGLEEGMEKGMEKGLTSTARNMLADGIPAESVAKYTGLSLEEVKDLC